jgi:hypothetical protein
MSCAVKNKTYVLSYEHSVFLEVTSSNLVEFIRRFREYYYPIYTYTRLRGVGFQVHQGGPHVVKEQVAPCQSSKNRTSCLHAQDIENLTSHVFSYV